MGILTDCLNLQERSGIIGIHFQKHQVVRFHGLRNPEKSVAIKRIADI